MRKFLLDNGETVIATTYEDFGKAFDSGECDVLVPMDKDVLDCDFAIRMLIYERIENVTIIKEL